MKKVKSGLVSNVWNHLQLFCLNHAEPVELELVQSDANMKEPYYRCSQEGCLFHGYMQRITFLDYETINEKLEAAMLNMGIMFDMTNFSYSIPRKEPAKALKVKVIECSSKHIKLGIK